MARRPVRRRHELVDALCAAIEGLLPGRAGGPRQTAADNRLFVDAALFVLKTGPPWGYLPERQGKPNTRLEAVRPLVRRGRLGRSRGGPTTKPHAAVHGRGRLVRLIHSPGQAGEAPQGKRLPQTLNADHVLADAAWDSDAICRRIKLMWARACIRPSASRRWRNGCDKALYRHMNVTEPFCGCAVVLPATGDPL